MRQYPIVLGLIASMVFYQLAHDANPAVWTYFTMLQFDWSKREVGFSLAFVGLMITIVQGGLIRSVIPRLGEARTAYLGLLMGGLDLSVLPFPLPAGCCMPGSSPGH